MLKLRVLVVPVKGSQYQLVIKEMLKEEIALSIWTLTLIIVLAVFLIVHIDGYPKTKSPTTWSRNQHGISKKNHIENLNYGHLQCNNYNNNNLKRNWKWCKRNRTFRRRQDKTATTLIGYNIRFADGPRDLFHFQNDFRQIGQKFKPSDNNHGNGAIKQLTISESYKNGPSADPNGVHLKHLMNNDDNLIEQLNHVLVNQNSFRERPIIVAEMRSHFGHPHVLVPVQEPISLISGDQSLPDQQTTKPKEPSEETVEITIQKSEPYFIGHYKYASESHTSPKHHTETLEESLQSPTYLPLPVPKATYYYPTKKKVPNNLSHKKPGKLYGKRRNKSLPSSNGYLQNFHRNVKMEYGFQPLFEPSPEIDQHGNII